MNASQRSLLSCCVPSSSQAAGAQELDLAGVYEGVRDGALRYRLQALVCHITSLHYVAYVALGDLWVRLDDAKVSVVGQLEHVLDECCGSRMQPEIAAFAAV